MNVASMKHSPDALRERKPPFSPDAVVDEFAAAQELSGHEGQRRQIC
jgi:hypothetical protein